MLIFSKIRSQSTKPETKIKIRNGSGRLPFCVSYNTGKFVLLEAEGSFWLGTLTSLIESSTPSTNDSLSWNHEKSHRLHLTCLPWPMSFDPTKYRAEQEGQVIIINSIYIVSVLKRIV